MSNNKQSSIEWFANESWQVKVQLDNQEISVDEYAVAYVRLLYKAKAMHKEEIERAHYEGSVIVISKPDDDMLQLSQQYYNETYLEAPKVILETTTTNTAQGYWVKHLKIQGGNNNQTIDMTWDEYGNPKPIINGGDNMNNNPGNLNMTALREYITMYLDDIDAYGEEDELTEATNVLHDFVMYLKSKRGLVEGETDGEQAMIDYNAMEEEWEMDNYNEMQ